MVKRAAVAIVLLLPAWDCTSYDCLQILVIDVAWSLFICVLVMTVSPAKTAELIAMLFRVLACMVTRNCVLDDAYGRHLANLME